MSPNLGRLGVYFEGRTVGEIIQAADETYSFHYAQNWLLSERSFPLSFALPLQEGEFDHKATLAFFENLLPEESVHEALAKQHRSLAAAVSKQQPGYLSLAGAQDGYVRRVHFFDLLCTASYPHLVRSFTYAIGDAVDYSQMGKSRMAAFEEQLGIKSGVFVATLAAMKTALAQHSASLAAQLKADHPQATIAPRIAALIDQRSRAFRWLSR